jgi:hypothetical protein
MVQVLVDRSKLAGFCRNHGISRLALFGSILSDRFRDVRRRCGRARCWLPATHAGRRGTLGIVKTYPLKVVYAMCKPMHMAWC